MNDFYLNIERKKFLKNIKKLTIDNGLEVKSVRKRIFKGVKKEGNHENLKNL